MLMASKKAVLQYRKRLSDISWLMRQLAEKVARLANAEDECTVRFWEGRFKSQPLLDDAAVLACVAYVDLNPIRAKIAETPEESDYTSVQDRIVSEQTMAQVARQRKRANKRSSARPKRRDAWLAPVYLNERTAPGPKVSKSDRRASDKGFLPIKLGSYLELVEWTGRQISKGKRGRIPSKCKPILKRLGLERGMWCELVENFGRLFGRVAGRQESLASSADAGGVSQRRSTGGAAILSPG